MNFNNNNNNNNNKIRNGSSCPKSGIKIHETQGQNQNQSQNQGQNQNQNQNQSQRHINTISTVKTQVSFHNTSLNTLDLDIEHYSLEDLYNLFNIENGTLDEYALKSAKQIVHKMHPDKSHLDPKYFRFFLYAYKRVYGIYEFQNKSLKKKYVDEDFFEDSNRSALDNMFQNNKTLKDSGKFNSWFNEKFDKHNTEESIKDGNGYGEWLKSDEGLFQTEENVTKTNMNEAFERQKKQIQSLTTYNGINDSFSAFSGSLLNNECSDNFSGHGYTDLRQAHMESVIPVTNEDFENMPKYKSFNDYKSKRDSTDLSPMSKQEGERILMQQGNHLDQQSAALAYKYAQQSERAKKGNQSFFSDIKQLRF
jgi:hypothetical protein